MLTRRFFLTVGLTMPALASIVGIGKTNAEAMEHQVEIRKFVFNPPSLDVKPGDNIVFINKDIVPHTVTETENSWDSGDLRPGDQWVMPVNIRGTINYFCRHHPAMKGVLISK